MKSYRDTKPFLNEMNTLLAESANLVNERPIGTKPNSQRDTEYLSTNSVLLGRVSSGPFQSQYDYDERPDASKTQFLLVQIICDQFWKVWTKVFFPTLLLQQKWHHQKRNVLVGDIQRRLEIVYCDRNLS